MGAPNAMILKLKLYGNFNGKVTFKLKSVINKPLLNKHCEKPVTSERKMNAIYLCFLNLIKSERNW
jgi:hypothetical protein